MLVKIPADLRARGELSAQIRALIDAEREKAIIFQPEIIARRVSAH